MLANFSISSLSIDELLEYNGIINYLKKLTAIDTWLQISRRPGAQPYPELHSDASPSSFIHLIYKSLHL